MPHHAISGIRSNYGKLSSPTFLPYETSPGSSATMEANDHTNLKFNKPSVNCQLAVPEEYDFES